jgi:glycosyltransferase involved in cell wall biosynthesis
MTFANKSRTGTRVYTQNLYRALEQHSDWQFRSLDAADEPARLSGGLASNLSSILWLRSRAETRLLSDPPDLFHAAAYLAPRHLACPLILNIFDTSYLTYPQHFDWKWKIYARTVIPSGVRRAAAILTLSDHARSEIARAYRISDEHVFVVPPGIGAEFQPEQASSRLAQVRESYGLRENYLLYVGERHPRKNLGALIEAFECVHRRFPELQFVLAGPRTQAPELAATIASSPASRAIRELGYVPQPDLPALYSGARAFVFASLLEGFGMPPLEAMACGTPVVCAPNPPMPQVLGDAALFTDDSSSRALAEGIERVLSAESLVNQLRARGITRAKRNTWELAAQKTIQVYESVLAAQERVR